MKSASSKIVVASSDPKEGKFLAGTLRGAHYRASWREKWNHCDLLLLDLSLPNAWKILRRVKSQNGNGTRVLAYDHGRNPLKELKAFHLGVDGFVGRPFLKEELLSQVGLFTEWGKLEKRYLDLLDTERRKGRLLEGDLKKLSDFGEKIASNIPLSIIIVNQEGKITYVNRNFCEAMGREEKQLLGWNLKQIFPETLYEPIGLIEKVDSVLRGHPATPRFSMAYRGDYYTYRVLPVVSRQKSDGSSRQAMILIENISELRSLGEKVQITEEKYRTLFESSPDGLLVTQREGGRVIEVSRRAEKLLGESKGKLRRHSLLGFYPTEVRPTVRKRLMEGAITHRKIELPDLVLKLPRQENRLLTLSVSPIFHAGEEALLCVLSDVTEKRFLEDQLRQAEKMSSLGQFTAGAAHEINNPLAIISSHAQYLTSGLEKGKIGRRDLAEIQRTLNIIDREAQHCGGIIRNLLAYTHTREVTKVAVDLHQALEDSLKLVAHQLKLSNIRIKTSIAPNLPQVLGDRNLLQQVFMNLIWNAQAAMPKGGELRIKGCHGSEDTVEISFEDTGMGIRPEHMEKIFEPFFTTKEVGKGTGLGLWVVRSILEELEGTIEVKNRVHRGATFTIRLLALPATEEVRPAEGNHS